MSLKRPLIGVLLPNTGSLMQNLAQLNIKEYDTIAIVCEYQGDDGSPLDLNGITIIADINSVLMVLIEPLNVDATSDTGRFTLSRTVNHLIVGQYRIDILFTNTSTGRRVSSETFILNVNRAVTIPR